MGRNRDIETAKQIEKNRQGCPTASRLAETLFDLAREHRRPALETLAIQVDGWAQGGRDLSSAEYNQVLVAAARAFEVNA